MSQSAVDCCNSALQRVGAASILSLSDNSPGLAVEVRFAEGPHRLSRSPTRGAEDM